MDNNKGRKTKERFVSTNINIAIVLCIVLSLISVLMIINIELRSLYTSLGRLNLYLWFGGSEPSYRVRLILTMICIVFLNNSVLILLDLSKIKQFGYRCESTYIIVDTDIRGEINGKYSCKCINWVGIDKIRVGQRYKIVYLKDSFRKYIVDYVEVAVDGAEATSMYGDISREEAIKIEKRAKRKKILAIINKTKAGKKVKNKVDKLTSTINESDNNFSFGLDLSDSNKVSIKKDSHDSKDDIIEKEVQSRLDSMSSNEER